MDEPLRVALGLPAQPAWFVRLVRRGLRARGTPAAPRAAAPRAATSTAPSTYPRGHRLSDLGPLSMLDALNAHPSTARPTATLPTARSTHA